jgi:hypothetical protein
VQRRVSLAVFPICAMLSALVMLNPAWARVPAPIALSGYPQAGQDDLFNQAVDAYSHNQFPQALAKFQQVSGSHAQEAQQYISKMKAYQEALEVAKSILDRSPDEQDAKSVAFAIQQVEGAMKIKPDGPWKPADLLARANELKAQVEKVHADRSKAMDSDYCARALAASQEHHFKDAARYICAVADDNPGYSCGGDEAVHMCNLNTELAKIDKSSSPSSVPEENSHSSSFDKAKAAYDKNDFTHARNLFQRVDVASKPEADQYLDKISRYNDAIASGERLSRDDQYDQARAAFLSAAAIKSDGPGDPQTRASAMELFVGLDQFYSGDYGSAIQHLQNCARTGTQKQPLVRFYLGASELAKFFVTGSEDASLQQDALNDLKLAKQAGFKSTGQDISPKILQVYKDLSF